MKTLSIERTGDQYSISGSEFLITFPDGTQDTIWSPPWHDMDNELEEAQALVVVAKLWYKIQGEEDTTCE